MNAVVLSSNVLLLPIWVYLISAILGLLIMSEIISFKWPEDSTTVILQLCGLDQTVLLQYVFSSAFYTLCLHPLKRFPGSLLRRVSRIPWMLSVRSGSIHRDLHHLHSVWGPVARVAPKFVDKPSSDVTQAAAS